MLLLGAVALFEPVNGYQIKRELTSWRVDEWASVGAGSIYGGLTTLEKLGQVVRHDLDDDVRRVAVYEITDHGRAELARLVGESLVVVETFNSVAFQAAFGLLTLLDRDVALRHLQARMSGIERALADPGLVAKHEYAPPHALHGLALWNASLREERAWLADTIDRLRAGEFNLAGEDGGWQPPADDPAWQMREERERYRRILGR